MTSRQLLSFPKWVATLAIGFGFFVSQASDASAQCLTPDGLSSSICCASVSPNLPTFPNFTMQAAGLCWNACNPLPKTCITLDVALPLPGVNCTQYNADMSVIDCTGVTLMKGSLRLDYTRTWSETAIPGAVPTQVWRFAAKVDLQSGTATPPVCAVPNCAVGGTAFYYGYVDYALDCGTGSWEQSVVLYHNCDRYIHGPGLSSTPGAFHPSRTFALVGPDTAANPFVPSILLPAAAPVMSEAVRTVSNAAGLCTAEERLLQGGFAPQATGCACPLMPQPPMSSANKFTGFGFCGSAFTSVNLFPSFPWYHLMTTSIGNWTTSASYPGPEHASVAEGVVYYQDACAPATSNQTFDMFYGGMTEFGFTFDPTLPLAPPSLRFLDLASNFSAPISGPIALPAVGKVAPTDHLIYVNL